MTIGRQLNGMPGAGCPQDQTHEELLGAKALADKAVNDARAQALGDDRRRRDRTPTRRRFPTTAAPPSAVTQPADVERFGASFFTWNGGSNFTDNPMVKVQRETARRLGGLRRPVRARSR